MRHQKRTLRVGTTGSHSRCVVANMVKSLIEHGQVKTTVTKAKQIRRYADRAVTLAKKNTLASRRQAVAMLMVRYNQLTSREARKARGGDTSAYNGDRKVINTLFSEIGPRFAARPGGYTRITRLGERRRGDSTEQCLLEYLSE